MKKSNKNHYIRLVEFLVIGLAMGITEDLLAVRFATDAKMSADVIYIVVIIAIPFALISELLVDHPDFWKKVLFWKKRHE